jgi:hypothetical protein
MKEGLKPHRYPAKRVSFGPRQLPPRLGTLFLPWLARAAPRPIRHATYKFSRGLAGEMKSNAAMAAISAAGHAMAGGKTFDEIFPTT